MPTRIAYFLMNMHTVPRPIYLVVHGETADMAHGLVGGDDVLDARGELFADRLVAYFHSKHPDGTLRMGGWVGVAV